MNFLKTALFLSIAFGGLAFGQPEKNSQLNRRDCIQRRDEAQIYADAMDLQWLDKLPQGIRNQSNWVVALNKTDQSILLPSEHPQYFLFEDEKEQDGSPKTPEFSPDLAYTYEVNCVDNPTICSSKCVILFLVPEPPFL